MPEYKRFIAYFYEYIDGKKQKNVGFAKVELRNGMWRILFRLTTGIRPEPPVQVHGFVRERGYLLGFPMGTMTGNGEIAQEWAYHAESPIGFGKYRLEDLAGIWIQSGEPRYFITVWDDDPVDPARFVLELPGEEEAPEKGEGNDEERGNHDSQAGDTEEQGEPIMGTMASGEVQKIAEDSATDSANRQELSWRQDELRRTQIQEYSSAETQSCNSAKIPDRNSAETPDRNSVEAAEWYEKETGKTTENPAEECISELLEKRRQFHPFMDDEMGNCVQILPCDIVRLQQENWQVGRSSFLQHGYYQYRHLLLGKRKDGAYVLGVPGILSQQEQYMAKMFGFDQFKKSKVCECGRVFGYWYRVLACGS